MKFILISTHPGVSFTWLVKHTSGAAKGEGRGERVEKHSVKWLCIIVRKCHTFRGLLCVDGWVLLMQLH